LHSTNQQHYKMSRKVSKSFSDIILAAMAKKTAKEQAKNAKKDAKEQEKLAKKAAKEQEKLDKKAAKEQEKEQARKAKKKNQIKELTLAIRAHITEKFKARAEKKNKRRDNKFEVQLKTLRNLIPAAKAAALQYPDGFTSRQFTDLYIALYGRINPYTTEPIADTDEYDIHAAIRGIMFETSPSSAQHWFRYGMQKVREQVAPWVFVNKQLAIVNDTFNWKVTTSEMAKARRQNKGTWKYMENGSHAFYDWSVEQYGPLPTEEVLKEAAIGRKIGVRKTQVQQPSE